MARLSRGLPCPSVTVVSHGPKEGFDWSVKTLFQGTPRASPYLPSHVGGGVGSIVFWGAPESMCQWGVSQRKGPRSCEVGRAGGGAGNVRPSSPEVQALSGGEEAPALRSASHARPSGAELSGVEQMELLWRNYIHLSGQLAQRSDGRPSDTCPSWLTSHSHARLVEGHRSVCGCIPLLAAAPPAGRSPGVREAGR